MFADLFVDGVTSATADGEFKVETTFVSELHVLL